MHLIKGHHVDNGTGHRDRVLAHVAPRAVRTALTPDGEIAILEDAVERLRILLP
jgi:hypothetical protein